MKGTRVFHVLILFTLSLLVWATAHGQGGNLLTNPGFEPPFQTLSGEPPRQVATGWTPWHIQGSGTSFSELIQPEYYPASDDVNGLGIPRIRSGNDAQQYFTFFATHSGGVYQTVSGVTSGTQYRFQVYAYVWSTSLDNVDVSDQPGGVIMQVGIDPTGGTNPESTNIVWSAAGSPQYDAYVPYEVTATAQSTSMTVFVRSTVSAAVKNNVIYLDDASLTTAGGNTATAVPPTATSVPPSATTVPPTATTAPPTATEAEPTATTEEETSVPPTETEAGTEAPPAAEPPPATDTIAAPTAEAFTPTNTLPPPTPSGPTNTPSPSPTVDRGVFPNNIVHNVRAGDTVARLAALYGSTIDAIISANGLNSNGLIFVGQGLVIPVRLAPPATATPIPTGQVTAAVTVTNPTAMPTLTSVPPVQPTTQTYIVRPGDTLSTIAVRFNTTTSTLAQLNNIVNRNLIYYGQRLVVPTGAPSLPPLPTAIVIPSGTVGPTVTPPVIRTYRVALGDNLYSIALRFSVPLSRLIQFNGIANPNRIYVGQVLVIP
jgi:LysM repeat protein